MNLKNTIRKFLLESEQDTDETLYKGLRQYIRGNISEYELAGYDSMILEVRHRTGHLGQATIVIDLENDDKLFELLGMSDDDGWFARSVSDRYGDGWEFHDYYNIKEDFLEGYTVFGDIEEDNREKIEKILFYFYGKKIEIKNQEVDENSKVAKLLNTAFPDEIENILREYRYEKNSEMNDVARESIMTELSDFLERIGFSLNRDFDRISTTPANLIMWYSKTQKKELNFEDLFKEIISETNTSRLGGWIDDTYQFQNSEYFNGDGFNREVERILDKIIDDVESDEFNLEEFKNLVNTVSKNFQTEKWYKLPKDKSYMFKIEGFDLQNIKINIEVKKEGTRQSPKEFSLSLDTFNRFLYEPELFGLSDLIPENRKK